jgi:hypothetical protein
MNGFQYRLAGHQKASRRARGERQATNSGGFNSGQGRDEQISTATTILAELIASDAAWLMILNGAIDYGIQTTPKYVLCGAGLKPVIKALRLLKLPLASFLDVLVAPHARAC